MRDYEQVLVGAWLRGEHLEDLKYVRIKDFTEPELIRGLIKGKTMLDLGAEMKRLPELAELSLIRSDTLYRQAFTAMIENQIREDIEDTTDLHEIRQKLEYLDSVTCTDVKEVEDPAVALAKEIEDRARRQLIKWDKMPSLNEMTSGIKRKELTAIAARPSVGKSAFALQIAHGAWKQGAKVLYFPLEMSANQSFGRVLIMNGYITAKELQTGKITNQVRYQKGIDYIAEMSKSKRFKVYEGESRIEAIESLIQQEEPFLVVIDQLTQMKASVQFKDLRLQFSYMTSNLKRIAMQWNVAVILLCQINRSADNVKPSMANLKESGSIEEDSDNVILLHRFSENGVADPSAYDWNTVRPMLLDLAKQRDGAVGDVEMIFKPQNMTFYEEYK